ncbi:cytochrome o ubiquinol oxidase subunit IV [Pelagibacterium halotolerans]|uniref:cytochrome o ubiquinol oxidase subunit IV n=1 Tax=Pelagibacterium halotolerans TaxID=531813 RepID=UPI00385098B4
MEQVSFSRRLRTYLTGFVLALVLTLIPFGLVATRVLPVEQIFAVIAVAAVAQVLVHLRFFLHLDWRTTPKENLLALGFAAVLICIMIGGSLVIMFNLHYRMWV